MFPQSPLFKRFPTDGGIYRCHWAGRLLAPKGNTLTPRLGVWLHKVIQDDDGNYIAEHSEAAPDKTLFTFLDESIGSIPAIAIDTYWQDGRPTKTPFRVTEPVQFELSGAPWEIVRAHAPISPGSTKPWVAQQEYSLYGLNKAGQPQRLFTTPLVVATTKAGVKLLIPPYEIFRAYFAGCTELALALVGGPFSQQQHALGKVQKVTAGDQSVLEVEVADHIVDIAARYLALFAGTDHGRKAASEIYTELLHQRSTQNTNNPWIIARPPFPQEQLIKLGVCGKWLQGQDRFLVYRIAHSPFPPIPLPVVQVKDKQLIPLSEESDPTGGNGPAHSPRSKVVLIGVEVGEAGDAKNNMKAAHMDSVAVTWEPASLPKIEKCVREKLYFPKPTSEKGTSAAVPTDVSVGNRSLDAAAPRGTFSPEAIEQVVSRFGAFYRCLQLLLTDKLIMSWEDCALVRPRTVQGRNYCAFIKDTNAVDAAWPYWPVIFKPSPRSRLCWVVRIVYKGKTVYWLEIEPREGKPHYALVFKPKEEPLKESTLERLINFCAASNGQFTKHASSGLEDTLTWRRARHTIVNGMHLPSKALGSITRFIKELKTGALQKKTNDDE